MCKLLLQKDELLEESNALQHAAEAYCILMQKQCARLQQQMNGKEQSGGNQQIGTTVRMLTSEELMIEWNADKGKKAVKAQKEADERAKKDELERQRQANRALGTSQFNGALSTKTKRELEDIAVALAIPEDGKKDDLVKRIRGHLNAHPELAARPRFSGLFTSLTRGRKRAAENEDGPAPLEEDQPNPRPFQHRRISPLLVSRSFIPPHEFDIQRNAFSNGRSTYIAAGPSRPSNNGRHPPSSSRTFEPPFPPQLPPNSDSPSFYSPYPHHPYAWPHSSKFNQHTSR